MVGEAPTVLGVRLGSGMEVAARQLVGAVAYSRDGPLLAKYLRVESDELFRSVQLLPHRDYSGDDDRGAVGTEAVLRPKLF